MHLRCLEDNSTDFGDDFSSTAHPKLSLLLFLLYCVYCDRPASKCQHAKRLNYLLGRDMIETRRFNILPDL